MISPLVRKDQPVTVVFSPQKRRPVCRSLGVGRDAKEAQGIVFLFIEEMIAKL